MKCLIAKKIGMTTLYSEGIAENVTLLEANPNEILTIRNMEKDGYSAVQVGLKNEKSSKQGKNNAHQYVCEFRSEHVSNFEKGKELTVAQFEKGEKVIIQGITKGKGNQGVVKRHGFKGSPASHGHRHDLRAPGSIGSAFPERVMKGKKMAGRMGSTQKTTTNLVVSLVDSEKSLLAVKGAVPGTSGSVVKIFSDLK